MSGRDSQAPRARALVIGLDGADLDVIEALGPERLPTLFAAMRRGAFAALQSVMPPATLPNWATFLTGVDPGVHGVFDFTTREGYAVRFTAGRVREAPTWFSHLDRLGMRTACLFFPGTYPPERLQHGVFVSGWDSPVAFEADASFVWPPALHAELTQRFGPQSFDDVDEFHADAEGFHASLPDALCARIARRTAVARHLLERQSWDVLGVYFGETDTASHHLWALWDARSPRHPAGVSGELQHGLARVYEAADRAVAELLASAGGDAVELTIVSDHGSGGSSDKVLYLNRVLAAAGLLSERPLGARLAQLAKSTALRVLPPRVRELVFRAAGTLLPSWLESRARFGAIDFSRTLAFSDELNYLPAIHYNLRGREPEGQLDPRDVPAVRARITEALLALRDPWSGAPVVRAVHGREELYRGPFVERAPDLLLELELDAGYSYNLMPSSEAPRVHGASARQQPLFRKLEPREYLGRKGRSLAGSHRPRGLYVAAGPRVQAAGRIEAHIADAAASLLARLEVAPPDRASGRVLPSAQPSVQADDRRVAERLRQLGYIE